MSILMKMFSNNITLSGILVSENLNYKSIFRVKAIQQIIDRQEAVVLHLEVALVDDLEDLVAPGVQLPHPCQEEADEVKQGVRN